MNRRLTAHALAALLALGAAAGAAAQPETRIGSLKGSILNRRGELVAGAVITVEGTDGGVRDVGYTEEGAYQLDLPPGVYYITLSSAGYYSLRRRRVRVRAGRTATINFTLEAARARRARRARRGAYGWTR